MNRSAISIGMFGSALGLSITIVDAALPPDYRGKPFEDPVYKVGPQVIPGKVECAYYDLGGEGVAYHDTDAMNNGNGVLNQQKNHQRPHATPYHWNFRANEGVDISYTKDFADFNHKQNMVDPPVNQFYIGWADDREWCNYTVDVKKAGTYKITALYGNDANRFQFSINNQPACECKFPVPTGSMHKWNKTQVGTITFPEAGVQLLTLHYNKGNNFAYFEFEAIDPSTASRDWPQWRGPNRDSVCTETGLLQEWPAEGPKLLWQCTGLGGGYATVAITGDRILTTGDRGSGAGRAQYVLAFDLASHKELWATPIGRPGPNGACSTPTVDGPLTYAISSDGNLLCVETATGKPVWKKSMVEDFGGKLMEQWKYSESPLVDGDKVVCTPGGKEVTMVALDKKTGEVIWKCPMPNIARPENKPGAGYGSIVVTEVDGLRQYVAVVGVGALGVAADTGKCLWSHNRIANYTANIPTPIVRGNYVFLIAGYETGATLLKLTRTGEGMDVEEIWAGARWARTASSTVMAAWCWWAITSMVPTAITARPACPRVWNSPQVRSGGRRKLPASRARRPCCMPMAT